MTRKRDYPIIRFLIVSFYALAVVVLVCAVGLAGYLWFRAEMLKDGLIIGGPLSQTLHAYTSGELRLAAAVLAAWGVIGFLLLGAVGQVLAMFRDRSLDTRLQVQLLEDILELNEEVARAAHEGRVDRCQGCGRLGSLHAIDSGQWVCRECRQQLRAG